ncbi:hypothetical protein LZC95_33890 [Pendulispora brunnea]|uniref:Cytochrome c domain-containing protein n=1 Tax=Pendulispora brunnea TaxID=2905690 RepID=A0ABZ2JYK7_9BACT
MMHTYNPSALRWIAWPILSLSVGCSAGSSPNGDEAESRGVVTSALRAPSTMGDEELARTSLRILGAKVADASNQCNRCHDVNNAKMRRWAKDYESTMAVLRDTRIPVATRLNRLRADRLNPAADFSPAHIGLLAGGAHLGTSPHVNPTRHPRTLEQGKLLAALFQGKDDEYAKFRSAVLMPVKPQFDRLTPSEYETVLTWVGKKLPKLDELLPDTGRPTSCTDDFEKLATHARKMRTAGWAAVNRDNRVPMFACSTRNPLECFSQKLAGKDVFPNAKDTTFAKTWAAPGSTVRVLRELSYKGFYWTRSSADGRFVGSGVSDGGEDSAVVSDLEAALHGSTRDIWVNANYDPSFYPDNEGFLFQGNGAGAAYCKQSLLTRPTTTHISFDEPECSKMGSHGLYQSVGQTLGDDALGDRFVVFSKWVGDDGGRNLQETDPPPDQGPDAGVTIHVLTARSSSDGYELRQTETLPTPFEGDTMMSPTTTLIANRVAGANGTQQGYMIRRVTPTITDTGYQFALAEAGRICMKGHKANFSYDERFLVTYHYLTREDFASDAEYAPYENQGASDIYVADMLTGKKLRVTRMAPGQFALFPHFRSDGWLYFTVRDALNEKEYIAATDAALRQPESP